MKKITMKKNCSKIKNRICSTAGATAGVVSMTLANTMPVYATGSTGISTVDTGMTVIKTAAIGIVSIIGVVALAKGAMDLGTGISQRDQQGITQGAAEIAGGLIMGGVGVVIGLFGF